MTELGLGLAQELLQGPTDLRRDDLAAQDPVQQVDAVAEEVRRPDTEGTAGAHGAGLGHLDADVDEVQDDKDAAVDVVGLLRQRDGGRLEAQVTDAKRCPHRVSDVASDVGMITARRVPDLNHTTTQRA